MFLGAIGLLAIVDSSHPATAVNVGELAPDFKLASTRGVDIGLADFRGNKWVFLEFYGGDFHPS
jgi:peroxiredoxin